MTYAKDKQEFTMAISAECEASGVRPAALREALPNLFRLANKHQALMVEWCNGDRLKSFASWDDWEAWRERETEKCREQITAICAGLGAGITVKFGGDPRGFTVKCHFPKTRAYNSWGGVEEGFGIPTRDM